MRATIQQIVEHISATSLLVSTFFKLSVGKGFLLYHAPGAQLIEIGEPAG
jgi:hypothetical protein